MSWAYKTSHSLWSLVPQREEEFLQWPCMFLWFCYSPIPTGKNDFPIASIHYLKMENTAWLSSTSKYTTLCEIHHTLYVVYSDTHEYLNFAKIQPATCKLPGRDENLRPELVAVVFSITEPILTETGDTEAQLPLLQMYFPLVLQLFLCCIQLVIMTSRDIIFLLRVSKSEHCNYPFTKPLKWWQLYCY